MQKAGIYISQCGYFTASPDGVVLIKGDNDTIFIVIEIKCPFTCSCKNFSVLEACSKSKGFFCEVTHVIGRNKIQLKKTHKYYQVQGVMAITGWGSVEQLYCLDTT